MQPQRAIQTAGLVAQLLEWLEPEERSEVVQSLVRSYDVHLPGGLPPIYTDQQVADRYGVSLYTVREWLNDGELMGFKKARQWFIREPELKAFEDVRSS